MRVAYKVVKTDDEDDKHACANSNQEFLDEMAQKALSILREANHQLETQHATAKKIKSGDYKIVSCKVPTIRLNAKCTQAKVEGGVLVTFREKSQEQVVLKALLKNERLSTERIATILSCQCDSDNKGISLKTVSDVRDRINNKLGAKLIISDGQGNYHLDIGLIIK